MPFSPLSNARFRRYSRLTEKRYRKKEGLYVIEGKKLVREAIRSSHSIEAVVISELVSDSYDFHALELRSKWTFTADTKRFSKLQTQEQSEGIIAILKQPESPLLESVRGPGFVLEGIRDPGNLGTLLRTADWFGFPAVYLTQDCVDVYNPKVLRAAMGAHFRVQLFVLDDLRAFVDAHAERMLATRLGGRPLDEDSLAGRDLILLGSESHGLSEAATGHPDIAAVEIPGGGGAESLNVGVAGAIVAFAVSRQLA